MALHIAECRSQQTRESRWQAVEIACDVCLAKQTFGQRPSVPPVEAQSYWRPLSQHPQKHRAVFADWASGDAALAFHKKKRKRRPDDIVG